MLAGPCDTMTGIFDADGCRCSSSAGVLVVAKGGTGRLRGSQQRPSYPASFRPGLAGVCLCCASAEPCRRTGWRRRLFSLAEGQGVEGERRASCGSDGVGDELSSIRPDLRLLSLAHAVVLLHCTFCIQPPQAHAVVDLLRSTIGRRHPCLLQEAARPVASPGCHLTWIGLASAA